MIEDGQHELPEGQGTLRVWTQRGEFTEPERWCCIAYDHGPMCRRCEPFDEVAEGMYEGVMEGYSTVRDHPQKGMVFAITEKGTARARQLLGIEDE